MSANRLSEFYDKIRNDLDRTVQFWRQHSKDEEYGGFFNCLSKEGKVYDDTKHVWLQARQVWMYARLYNEVERFKDEDLLQQAVKGADFLLENVRDPNTYKCSLIITRDGKPIKIQRTLFSECFYLMAMSEVARATGIEKYKKEAITMMEKIRGWIQSHGEGLGFPKLSGVKPRSMLAIAMMTLCIIDQLRTMDPSLNYDDLKKWALNDALKHVQRNGTVILETTTNDGKEMCGSAGRLMIPGHSIEAGWFLLSEATRSGDDDLKKVAITSFIVRPFEYGWDQEQGGLFYFLDVDGWCPVQLEWDMKLWWAHNEALIAFLMAYKETKDPTHLEKFAQIFDYCYSHFVDKENGEWFGYLRKDGSVSLDFKGGPWKGCFHVPRCLMMCEKMLEELLENKN
ncbi:N-acylglucosamine 2-epimerase-like [Saccostrea echinata]|uniref:N-acylglucosamine 2-epimerase-like n=1 Tax=Saccostrea echinata TaxID=191078 RepID=UPI002A8119B3|nr:N-acylglucosamine 2-epimerase-like [Saccostrea echinata]